MATPSTTSNENFFDGSFVRKATDMESYFEEILRKGIFSLCYTLRLKSKSPLQEDQVRTALTHLYRKCPSLRFCYGYRDGSTWIKKPSNPDVDFEVIENQGLEELRTNLLNYCFKSETGPLFCARLVQNAKDYFEPSDKPENLPFYTSYMLFGLHHGIGDATGISYILGFFISILNDVISGQPISDEEPLGKIAGTEYLEEELEIKKELLRGNPALKEEISQEIEAFERSPALIKTGFPIPKGERETRVLEYVFDQEITTKFLKRCKQEGVTFNSGYTAAVNVALTDLLLENGIELDYYTLKTYALVNLRRYSKTDISSSLGVHSGYPLSITTQVPGKLGSQFWHYARALHDDISHCIKSGKCLLIKACTTLSHQEKSTGYLEDDKPTFSDFAISNIGEITHMITEGGEEVRPTHFLTSLALHHGDTCPISISCHTFLGKFTFSINYSTAVVERDVAKRFCRQVVTCMLNVLQ